jgi:alpha-L-fucosidase 2
MEMYKLGCSSVPGGYPITLQGLWTLDGGLPPWSGDYHLDMNVQQSYWPIYAANRLELGEPLYRTFSACLPRWQKQCQEFFGFDGAWAGCAIGPRGERIYGYSGVELWPGNAAWLAHHYWLHWLYSQDKEFLRSQAMPMIRACFLTYANLLEKGEDGKLHVPLSYSPEYHEGSFKAYAPDPACDLALIRMLGKAILGANAALGQDDELTPRVNEVLANLVDYPQKDNKVWISGDQPMERSHRHHSQLMMLHPLEVVSPENGDAEKNLIMGSLLQIRVLGTGQWTGWSFPWMSLIAGRAGYGNWAYEMLDGYANGFILPNTFHVNGDPRVFGRSLFEYTPMTLEAGFGAAAAIQEMLLQSQGGVIRVFPSMPDRWHDAEFENLRAEGAFVVSARKRDGIVEYVRIHSEAGGKCRVRNPFVRAAWIADETVAGTQAKVVEAKDGIIEFETAPNSEYRLFSPVMVSGSVPYEPEDKPLSFERSAADQHFFGLKKLARY